MIRLGSHYCLRRLHVMANYIEHLTQASPPAGSKDYTDTEKHNIKVTPPIAKISVLRLTYKTRAAALRMYDCDTSGHIPLDSVGLLRKHPPDSTACHILRAVYETLLIETAVITMHGAFITNALCLDPHSNTTKWLNLHRQSSCQCYMQVLQEYLATVYSPKASAESVKHLVAPDSKLVAPTTLPGVHDCV